MGQLYSSLTQKKRQHIPEDVNKQNISTKLLSFRFCRFKLLMYCAFQIQKRENHKNYGSRSFVHSGEKDVYVKKSKKEIYFWEVTRQAKFKTKKYIWVKFRGRREQRPPLNPRWERQFDCVPQNKLMNWQRIAEWSMFKKKFKSIPIRKDNLRFCR